ncbi:hypothetical protein [Thermophagus xiamenensis]|uniref:Uncharacterized protein n=1 Tax=Thermophagus xiamenensis TaxID=385682 RepID=A0A1I1VHG1_9BACT|nr:hypothetical protein [Thermophagus xiamenensis]SFD82421.1 hypothetical protein SAMN05444380_102185 [Thermophagus xiamenensis]
MSVEKRVDLTHLVESYAGDLYSWALHKVSDKEPCRCGFVIHNVLIQGFAIPD